jgi:UDP-N-acetylmuramate dehydrogenase
LTEHGIPFKVIGGMTNLLIKNGWYNGVVVKTDKIQAKSLAESKLTVSCGSRLSAIIRSMASVGLGGMEGLSGIPGTLGGMVRQNAGAFGYEIADRFISADCYLFEQRELITLDKADMRFSYRDSVLSNGNAVLISATFDLLPMRSEEIFSKIREFAKIRRATQPIEFPSLGSVFKRHDGQSAGFYIDRAGLKGAFVGGAAVSEKHAGFIVNKGGATADDFLALIDKVKTKVHADFGIELEEEIEII